jgi:two-component system invasion response regulator UvrY
VIRVLIADDHAILRRGLQEILVRELEGAVCGEAKDAAEILARIQEAGWDIVILDISMPGRSGLDVLRDLKAARPKLPVLVLSMHPEDQYGKRMLSAGAAGYMNKESAPKNWSSRTQGVGRRPLCERRAGREAGFRHERG